MNLEAIGPGEKAPTIVNCIIEIPKGGTNKFEYDYHKETFKLDRVLHSSVFYPTEYGFIPQTKVEDGDPLDIMVIATFSTFPGCLIRARVIGALKMTDNGRNDTKIIGICYEDPRMKHVKHLKDLPPHFKSEVENFFQSYAELEPTKKIDIQGWSERKVAKELVKKAIEAY